MVITTVAMATVAAITLVDEVLTASYTGGNTGIDHGTDLD